MKKFLSFILVFVLVLSMSSVAMAADTLTGSGTEGDPYLINNLEELKLFRDSVNGGNNYAGEYVQLAADINMSSVDSWIPIGNKDYVEDPSTYIPSEEARKGIFSGVFDGNGKVLSNLKIEKPVGGVDTQANLGLFGIIGEKAVIKNLTITNVNINTDGRNIGALAGVVYKATLDKITVNGNIQIKGGNNVSGVCGMIRYADVSVTNITVSGNDGSEIIGNNIVGGIACEMVKYNNQTFSNLSVENVAITGVGGVGGIVGLLTNGDISNVSVKNVALTGRTDYQGDAMGRIRLGSIVGLLGGTSATISNINAIENVTAKNLDGNDVKLPVIGANYGASSNATEARIGDIYYATLVKAVDAAVSGDTITLVDDIVVASAETIEIPADKKIKLDLDEHTVTGSNTTKASGHSLIVNKGELTIVGPGKITYFAQSPDTGDVPGYASNTISNYGILTIQGAEIENTTHVDARAAYAIDNYSGGSLTVEENSKISAKRIAIRLYANKGSDGESSVTINGGTISANHAIFVQQGAAANAGKINITGGNIEGNSNAVYFWILSDNMKAEIEGGEFSGEIYFSEDDGIALEKIISGGTFDSKPDDTLIADGMEANDEGGKWGVQPIVVTYTVTALASPTDAGRVSGGGTYEDGEKATLTANANAGYSFVKWVDEEGKLLSDEATHELTVTENVKVFAIFEKIVVPSYTVTVSASPEEGGSVSGGGSYEEDTSVTVTATANDGYTFKVWVNENGDPVSNEAEYTFTVTENCELVAVFEEVEEEPEAPVITHGMNGEFDGENDLTFRSNADFADFECVKVDCNVVDKDNYTVSEGSTVVILKAAYLKTLSVGVHELAIVSETGEAKTNFTVKAAAEEEPPKPTKPDRKDIKVKYEGGNRFSTNKSAVPTSVEIDGVPVSFVGDGRSFTVSCIEPGTHWITVRWHSTSVTTNFTADVTVTCVPTSIPKTGDVSVMAYALMAVVAAAGAMLKK